ISSPRKKTDAHMHQMCRHQSMLEYRFSFYYAMSATSLSIVLYNSSVPTAMSASVEYWSGWWLMPSFDLTIIIALPPASAIWLASWKASLIRTGGARFMVSLSSDMMVIFSLLDSFGVVPPSSDIS